MDREDKQWASKYLLDPLNEPQPGQETGPGTHFRSTFAPAPPSDVSSIISSRKEGPSDRKKPADITVERKPSKRTSVSDVSFRKMSVSSKKEAYPSPPQSASPRREKFAPRPQSANTSSPSSIRSPSSMKSNNPYRQEAFGTTSPTTSGAGGRRRGSSLGERFAGDQSHRPLDMLVRDQKTANRAPHLRKRHQVGVDTIDDLDNVGPGKYHHEGPFDATYYTRNTSFTSSPIEALKWSNEEALKATPKERILDSVRGKRPLDGVATYPPGEVDESGKEYSYQEGDNMMLQDGANYKRWPGVKYLDEDIKGKGEPSYTLEKALKEHKGSGHRRVVSNDIEMTTRPRSSSGREGQPEGMPTSMWDDGESQIRRNNTTGGKLRKRLGLAHRNKS